jgi:hypothetical protein
MNINLNLYRNGYSTKNIVIALIAALEHTYSYLNLTWHDLYYDLYFHMYERISYAVDDDTWMETISELNDDGFRASEELREDILDRVSGQRWPTKPYRETTTTTTAKTKSKYCFNYTSWDWDGNPSKGRCLVELVDHDLKFTKLKGADPTIAQVGTIVEYVASKTASLHRYNRCDRVHPYKTTVRTGYSGCRDVSLDLYKRRGDRYVFMHRAAALHISMYQKVGDFQMYIGDILEILLAVSVGDDSSEYDFGYNTSKKWLKKYGIEISNLHSNEVLEEDELTFIPKESHCRRPSRRNIK